MYLQIDESRYETKLEKFQNIRKNHNTCPYRCILNGIFNSKRLKNTAQLDYEIITEEN